MTQLPARDAPLHFLASPQHRCAGTAPVPCGAVHAGGPMPQDRGRA